MTGFDSVAVSRGRDDPERLWYGRAVWKRLRSMQLARAPLCAFHAARGETVVATVVDHIEPWRKAATRAMRWALFVDPDNHQSLCATCHNSDKQIIERGKRPEIGADGWPIDAPD